MKTKKNKYYKNVFARRSARIYPWLLWGFVAWFAVLFFALNGIMADILETPMVPDRAIPYDKNIAQRVHTMTEGYPIAAMSEYIARFDSETSAYLVAIAKKESDWGKHVPLSDDGRDCFNYWGFRDPDNTKGSAEHSCFASSEQAVRAVGKRVRALVHAYKRDTPKEMAVWKCGSACDFSDASVAKWVSDVDVYREKFFHN